MNEFEEKVLESIAIMNLNINKALDRIAEALEEMINIQKRTAQTFLRRTELEGETSVVGGERKQTRNLIADSKPLPKVVQTGQIKWIVHEERKYKACKFCENLVSWNHDTNNYDHFNHAFKYLYPKCNNPEDL